jgi:nucleoside-triphosphatase
MMKNLLITGAPGLGKTTIIKKISNNLKQLNLVGFYTQEIRENKVRRGFELVALDGRKSILSDVDIKTPYRVGRYGVDLKGFDEFLEKIDFLEASADIVLIDEIGKMECCSEKFKSLIREILNSEKWFVGTVALYGKGLIEEVKKRKDVRLIEVTLNNRDSLPSELISCIRKHI